MRKRRHADGRRLEDAPYLAPELLHGGEAGLPADVYAFGCIMYETLKQELIAADIAVKSDLHGLTDADALVDYAQSVLDGERCAPAAISARLLAYRARLLIARSL